MLCMMWKLKWREKMLSMLKGRPQFFTRVGPKLLLSVSLTVDRLFCTCTQSVCTCTHTHSLRHLALVFFRLACSTGPRHALHIQMSKLAYRYHYACVSVNVCNAELFVIVLPVLRAPCIFNVFVKERERDWMMLSLSSVVWEIDWLSQVE